MSRRILRPVIAIGAIVLLMGVAAGAAAAYWQVPGTGTGAAATGATTSAITLTPGTASGDLYPGGSATVTTTANNSNGASVRVGSLVRDVAQGSNGFAVDAAHSGCPTSTFGFTSQNNGGVGWTVAGNGSLAISMPGALTMSASAANACQGVTVTVYLKAQP